MPDPRTTTERWGPRSWLPGGLPNLRHAPTGMNRLPARATPVGETPRRPPHCSAQPDGLRCPSRMLSPACSSGSSPRMLGFTRQPWRSPSRTWPGLGLPSLFAWPHSLAALSSPDASWAPTAAGSQVSTLLGPVWQLLSRKSRGHLQSFWNLLGASLLFS